VLDGAEGFFNTVCLYRTTRDQGRIVMRLHLGIAEVIPPTETDNRLVLIIANQGNIPATQMTLKATIRRHGSASGLAYVWPEQIVHDGFAVQPAPKRLSVQATLSPRARPG
jgi:hypothetical protein